MKRFLAFDLARLFIGPLQLTPRGIDRVEIGYLRHFLYHWPGDCVGILPTPWGARIVARDRAIALLQDVLAGWHEEISPSDDAVSESVWRWIGSQDAFDATSLPAGRQTHLATAIFTMLGRLGLAASSSSAAQRLPKGALYLNIGQVGLAIPQFLSWLGRRPDVSPVFMLHDTIPIDHSEFVPPLALRFHRKMIENTARHASGLIVTTDAARADIMRALRPYDREDIPVLAAPLPVGAEFARDADRPWSPGGYFVIAGSIEPRKNHALLLAVWRALIERHGAQAPKLVVAGTVSRGHDVIKQALNDFPQMRRHVVEVKGISTPSLSRLMRGAYAVLMPSFAEGFGLPIVEALAVGTPVIASDIPAHREAGGDYAAYIAPTDEEGWRAAVESHVSQWAAHRKRLETYRPLRWTDYFQRIEPFLFSAGIGTAVTTPAASGGGIVRTEPAAGQGAILEELPI